MLVSGPSLPPAPQGKNPSRIFLVYAKKYSKNDSQAPWIVVVIEGNAWGNWEQREVKQVIFYFPHIQCRSTAVWVSVFSKASVSIFSN